MQFLLSACLSRTPLKIRCSADRRPLLAVQRYNYRFNGKQKTLALGVYPDVPLEKARVRHQAARRLLAAGTDPSLRRQALRTHGAAELGTVEGRIGLE